MNTMKNGSKKNILLIAPSLKQGGLERICVKTARLLAPYYHVTIAVFDDTAIAYDVQGLSIISLRLPARKTLPGKALNLALRIHALKKLKTRLLIHLSYSFGQTANLANSRARTRDKIICSIRSFQDFDNPEKIRSFCASADLIACCSKAIEEKIRTEYGCEKTVTLYNPVEVAEEMLSADMLADSPAAEAAVSGFLSDHGPLLATMGCEDDIKGFWHLLKAFAHYRNTLSGHDTSNASKAPGLFIIGNGSFTEYKKLAEDLGVSADVCFTGLLRNPFPLLRQCDAYVLTSIMEGFPNALVEAMALGLPCIATDCPTGPREIFETTEGTQAGILIPPLSAEKNLQADFLPEEDIRLAENMHLLLSDATLSSALSDRARKRAAGFSEQTYLENCLRIFEYRSN